MKKETEMKTVKISEGIGELTNEISKMRKEVKAGKRDRSMVKDALDEGRYLLNLIKTKVSYEKDNGRKPLIKMLDRLEL